MSSNVFFLTEFNLWQKAIDKIGEFGETVLYADLDRQLTSSVLTNKATGIRMIPRNREQIADRHHWTVKTAKRKFQDLVNKGFFTYGNGMWYGKKSFFISPAANLDVWLDYEKLNLLTSYTKSHEGSMMLSFMDYCCNKRPIKDNNKVYAFVSRPKLAKLLQCSPETVDNYAKKLKELGAIDYYMRNGWKCRNFYVTINEEFYNKVQAEWVAMVKAYKEQKLAKQEKITRSIKITHNNDDLKNNNTAHNKDIPIKEQNGDIILSRKEQRYLKGALARTLNNIPDNPYDLNSLFRQILYAITNQAFRKTTQSFNHAVNRFMFLIRERRWGVPFGYNKYDSKGQKEWQEILERENSNRAEKSKEQLIRTNQKGEKQMGKAIVKSPLGFEIERDDEEPIYNFKQTSPSVFVKEYNTSYEYTETAVQKACREAIERDIAQKKLQEKTA